MASKTFLGSLFQRDYVRKGDLYYQKGQLRKAAEMYLRARRYQRASQIYVELGGIERAVEVLAAAGQHKTAGEVLAADGRFKEAISLFEEAGAYREAAQACLEAQQLVRAGRLFEQAGMYRRAAEAFHKAKEIEHTLGAWELEVGRLKRQREEEGASTSLDRQIRQLDLHRAEILASLGRSLEAGKLLREHDLPERAAPMFEKSGAFEESAAAYLAAGHLTKAFEAIEKAPDADLDLRAEIYRMSSHFAEAGDVLERLGQLDRAAEAYEDAERWAKAAALYEKARDPLKAAELFARVDRHLDAGRCFAKAQEHTRAAEAFAKAGNPQGAADAYLAAGDDYQAGKHYYEAGLTAAARDAFDKVGPKHERFVDAAPLLIELLVSDSLIEDAQHQLELLEAHRRDHGKKIDSVELLYWRGRLAEASSHYGEAEIFYQRVVAEQHGFRDAADRIDGVRGKVSDNPETGEPDPHETTSEFDTGPVTLVTAVRSPEPTAIELPTDLALNTPQPEIAAPLQQSAELPFEIDQRLDPWWEGAEFFRARDDHREVLLVSFPLAEVGSQTDSFRRGMREVVALRHPVVLKLDDVVIASDKVLLVFEPFFGQTLDHHLSDKRPTPLEGLYLIIQLCEALAGAHQLGVTHQWLSPLTVLIDDEAHVKLIGFGMREVLAEKNRTSRAYLSPEVRADAVVGPASDVFCLGLLAVELLQAMLPVGWAVQEAIDPDQVGWPEEVEKKVPAQLLRLLIHCLATDPLARPSTAELKATLATIGLVPGQILADRYRIQGELGRGGMSRVYRARDLDLDESVAIKTVLTPSLGRSEEAERLLQEVRICRKITHPNVVRVHDFGRFPGGIFVIMELLDGPGLDAVITHEAPLPLPRVRDILRQIAAALGEAHRLEIIHRDLKPANVIFTGNRLKVMDFGIARMGDGGGQLTQTGQVIGSPKYMAPEQIQGLPLAGTCDLYALGVIAYTLLAGREPFVGKTTTAVVLKHLHEPPPAILELRPDLPQEWIDFLSRLLAKQPQDRLQTAKEVAEALDQLPEQPREEGRRTSPGPIS